MGFVLNFKTEIVSEIKRKPVLNGIKMLKRDMAKIFNETNMSGGQIVLIFDEMIKSESYKIKIDEVLEVRASDDLGFIYGLLYISERYLGILPFWFWMDQPIQKKDQVEILPTYHVSPSYAVKYRGWFFNDEVLLMQWQIGGDPVEPWRMAFETLLRCGGNMTIPGTDKMARVNQKLAAEFGLWITHHHAEPLGAEMFARAYPGVDANYLECPELFHQIWEDAVLEQKDYNVIWNLCFRGQGDHPFWSSDTTGQFDTKEKRGALISALIKKQWEIVKKHVRNPICCTNLYGEIMELYNEGHIEIDPDIIKVRADNGYGKMVTRRRENHNTRSPSMPEKGDSPQGIYYHVSFYDLQAANHITMLPNGVDFVNAELSKVLENDGDDFWVINCSNVKPHVYYLDAIRKKWGGLDLSDDDHSMEFAHDYFGSSEMVAKCLQEYPKAMIKFKEHDDEHAGEQFYTENVRLLSHHFIKQTFGNIEGLNWLIKGDFYMQAAHLQTLCEKEIYKLEKYFLLCQQTSERLSNSHQQLFDTTIFLQAKIHYYCAKGTITFCQSLVACEKKAWKKGFILAGDAASWFNQADQAMRESESGVWEGFYFNECLADVKYSAYMIRKMRGVIRELGDSPRHDKWYRDTIYAPEDQNVVLLLVVDNHMTDEALYLAMKEKKNDEAKSNL